MIRIMGMSVEKSPRFWGSIATKRSTLGIREYVALCLTSIMMIPILSGVYRHPTGMG